MASNGAHLAVAAAASARNKPVGVDIGELLRRLEAATGHKVTPEQRVIPEGMTFTAWCEKLGLEGLKVDGRPFTLADRPAMRWLYDQVPHDTDGAFRRVLVLMKCAQVGFTVMEMLATIYLALRFGTCTVGMFLPDQALAQVKSTERFMPIVRTVPDAHRLMTQDAADGSGRTTGEGNVRTRRIGDALMVFAWTSGRSTTESIPMDVLSFDEVQEMSLAAMEKTQERLSASKIRYTLMGSTANFPDSDIHHWYKRGTQHEFHTECPTCGRAEPLAGYFPLCIRWDPEKINTLTKRPGTHRYVCREGHWIDDPQRGEWVAKHPEAWITSAQFPQMLSPTISPDEIIEKYENSTNKKNFWNRVLGQPYLDPSEVPVSLEAMNRCAEEGMRLGLRWKSRAHGTFMGVDQMGNFNVVWIKERMPDGRQAVVHIEEVYDADPFERCAELMEAYGVAVAVVEINPNYNDAKKFANRFPGRVFICDGFRVVDGDMIEWGDRAKLDPSERRTDEGARDRWTVKADQFKCMQVSLSQFTSEPPQCLFPNPADLVQEIKERGIAKLEPVAPRAFHHMTKVALITERVGDESEDGRSTGSKAYKGTNKYRRVVRKISIDPHHAYANQLCDVAYSRAHRLTTVIFPPESGGRKEEEERRMAAQSMNVPGLPSHVVGMMEGAPTLMGEVCGRCVFYPFGGDAQAAEARCAERDLIVAAVDPGCPFYTQRD